MENYEEKLTDEKGLIQKISNLFQDQCTSDITLKIGEHEHVCHKFILSASSEVFTRMFDMKWKNEKKCDKESVLLEESFEAEQAFPFFLKFLYTGEVTFTNKRVIGLICLADKYDVVSLRTLALDYMYRNSVTPNLLNALQWYSWSKMLSLTYIQTQCWDTICSNFQKLVTSTEIWESLDINLLCELLESSSLIVESEFSIFETCKMWLSRDGHLEDINYYAERIFSLIRFSLMTPAQLLKIETGDFFSEFPKVKKMLKKQLLLAHKYRSMCSHISDIFNEEWYNPRNYTNLIVDKINTKNFTKFSNTIDKTSIKTPYFSNETMDWKLTYRKMSEKWTVMLRSNDKHNFAVTMKIQFVLIATNNNDEVINVVHSQPLSYTPFIQERVEIDMNGREIDLKNILIIIKMLIY